MTKISDRQIQNAIERAVHLEVRKAVQAQMKKLSIIASIPYASDAEQKDIVKSLNKMSAKDREIVKTIRFSI